MSKKWDHLFKVIVIGDSFAGKSTLVGQFCEDGFSHNYIPTIGLDFKVRQLMYGEKKIKLQIWDTAGQERFRTLTKGYYRNADAAILVYDVTNPQSFVNVGEWIRELQSRADPLSVIIVGNKIDEIKMVQTKELSEFAEKYNFRWYETSAKMNIGIEMLFQELVNDLCVKKKISPNILTHFPIESAIKVEPPIKLTGNEIVKTRSGCCN